MQEVEARHFHLFCGSGGGAKGFNRGKASLGQQRIKWRCLGGVDSNPACIRDFARLSGVKGTVLDLFDRGQYVDFHGKQPPSGWREATPEDVFEAAGREFPNVVFLSAPCKGFSGLLSETKSKTNKYQALNRLTLRGVWLMLEAFKDNLPELIIFENVPRIATRGRKLLDQINGLLDHFGYAVAETVHDCGEIGGLAQSRKRFLLVARQREKVPAFLYQPERRPLRAVGDVLSRFPMPGDSRGGPMHLLPNLQWKTWVRLAFVEAGSDWRSLNKLKVQDGFLRDFGLVPDWGHFNGALGVNRWDEPSGVVSGSAAPTRGKVCVADPRFEGGGNEFGQYGVKPWAGPASTVTAQRAPGQGPISVADPRLREEGKFNNCYRIVRWDQPSPAVSGGTGPSAGGLIVADPRTAQHREGGEGVLDWKESSGVVAGRAHPSNGRYAVTRFEDPTGTVIGGDDAGTYSVADPRPNWEGRYGNMQVADWGKPSSTVIGGGKGVQGGWLSVADPRPGGQKEKGDHYLTNSHYGVTAWDETAGAVSGAASVDNGKWSVADPRLPEADQKMVCMIRSLDDTWHRPFTTLELAALQSLIDPDDIFDLDGTSDGQKRERIGNAVPAAAAEAVADVMGQTLLLAWSGVTFQLSATPIWVQPIVVALSVDPGRRIER
jgi:site-specific DNA-cytosine methylase